MHSYLLPDIFPYLFTYLSTYSLTHPWQALNRNNEFNYEVVFNTKSMHVPRMPSMKLTFKKNIGHTIMMTMSSMIGLLCLCKKSGVTLWLVTSTSTISWIKSFYHGYLIMDDFQLNKLCSTRQMNLKQFKFFWNHGSLREMGPSSSRTHGSWGKWMFLIHILQTFFQIFIQYIIFIHDMQNFFQLFIHIMQHCFSTFHCEMLHYIDEIT